MLSGELETLGRRALAANESWSMVMASSREGASVYAGRNANGRIDAADGAPSAISGTDGRFDLTEAEQAFAKVGVGGTDPATGAPLLGVLKAPPGGTIISPLRTLVA